MLRPTCFRWDRIATACVRIGPPPPAEAAQAELIATAQMAAASASPLPPGLRGLIFWLWGFGFCSFRVWCFGLCSFWDAMLC